MFSEREQAFLKAITITSLQIVQRDDFRTLGPAELTDAFNEHLDDYLFHIPLNKYPDAD